MKLNSAPVLVLAYNRPQKLEKLLLKLKQFHLSNLIIVIDGPKAGNLDDYKYVQATIDVARKKSWAKNTEVITRQINIGLKNSVIDAVTNCLKIHEEVIVIEDDCVPTKTWIYYANMMLQRYKHDDSVFHISGYNAVPLSVINSSPFSSRLSIYVESYAWATWKRAWEGFDGGINWARHISLNELRNITGSYLAAIKWKQNILDAKSERISTWAYRWMFYIWSKKGKLITPNTNLVDYRGHDSGTHTVLPVRWKELPSFDLDEKELNFNDLSPNQSADKWAGKYIYSETVFGILFGIIISTVLEIRKHKRNRNAKRQKDVLNVC